MTDAEWEREHRRLKGAKTRAANAISKCTGSLQQKLALCSKFNGANAALTWHRLNRWPTDAAK